MRDSMAIKKWSPGVCPIAVILISLNEGHNLRGVLENLSGWAQEVFLVDSYSQDETVEIALDFGVRVVQRSFDGFGNQWNFALNNLPISSSWVMKLDPDERLTDSLKVNLCSALKNTKAVGFTFKRQLWFMGKPLPIYQTLLRVWRTGMCHFSDVLVNEHPIVEGRIDHIIGILAHHDSPDLDHWVEKQNRYTTAEAIIAYKELPLSGRPILTGTKFQRHMWLKKNFRYIPFRFFLFFIYNWLFKGVYLVGREGDIWARMRSEVMRLIEYKEYEIRASGKLPARRVYGPGKPNLKVEQF